MRGVFPSVMQRSPMSADLDFDSLYRELRLTPSATLADMKLAYRRRVAELHPDRIADREQAAQAALLLQQLTRLYGQALDFQRRHGRLPGSRPATAWHARSPPPQATTTHTRRRAWLWAFWISVLCAVPVVVELSTNDSEPNTEASLETPPTEGLQVDAGMRREQVLRLLGPPDVDDGDRWEYGPSWLSFDHDVLVDWYSSPQRRPLDAATATSRGAAATNRNNH